MPLGKKRIIAEGSLAASCISVSVNLIPDHDDGGSSAAGYIQIVSLLPPSSWSGTTFTDTDMQLAAKLPSAMILFLPCGTDQVAVCNVI